MKQYPASFLKYVSVIHRNSSRYFDMVLEPYQIGSGQQFFLRHICENNGISMYDLAQIGHFDKGTVTKAVHKLAELGYVTIVVDEKDRRVKHVYVTEQAHEVLEFVYEKRNLWKSSLTKDISPEKEQEMEQILKMMAEISCEEICKAAKQREEINDKNN